MEQYSIWIYGRSCMSGIWNEKYSFIYKMRYGKIFKQEKRVHLFALHLNINIALVQKNEWIEKKPHNIFFIKISSNSQGQSNLSMLMNPFSHSTNSRINTWIIDGRAAKIGNPVHNTYLNRLFCSLIKTYQWTTWITIARYTNKITKR